jgi:LacI family transcriptional regulator, galactose operon repressor
MTHEAATMKRADGENKRAGRKADKKTGTKAGKKTARGAKEQPEGRGNPRQRRPAGNVTILDIARHAGVSKSTVSLVLQGSPLVRPSTAKKVQKAITSVGYVYNRSAANLRRARTNLVGMIINDLTNPFFAEMAVGMERVFQAAGLVPLMANTAESPARQDRVVRALMEQGVAGMIVSPALGTPKNAFKSVQLAKIPLVLAMRRLPGSTIGAVAPDNEKGARAAARHLIDLGHARIAFLGGYTDMVVHHDRLAGYRAALIEAGLAFDPGLVIEEKTNRLGGMAAFARATNLPHPPTAALCFNDAVAFGVMMELRKQARVPGDNFAVVGFDDVTEARHYVPGLTSVSVEPAVLGEQAAKSILEMIESGTIRAKDHVGPVELVVRGSSGATKDCRQTLGRKTL